MREVVIDFETRSTADLRKVGSYVYSRCQDTSPICLAWQVVGDDRVLLWRPDQGVDHPDLQELYALVGDGHRVVAHNVKFELDIWSGVMAPRYGAPPLLPEQTSCTMARALALSLPAGLEDCMAALQLGVEKDMVGHRTMLQMAKPRSVSKTGEVVWWDDANRLLDTFEYCRNDVRAEALLHAYLPEFSGEERELYELDLQINQRGVPIDVRLVQNLETAANRERARINRVLGEIDPNLSGTRVAQLLAFVRDRGVNLPNMSKETVLGALAQPELDDACRQVLFCRQQFAKSSTYKLARMLASKGADGRIRNTFQFNGAGATGRWAGRIIQPQNMPRQGPSGFKTEALADDVTRAGPGLIDMVSTEDQPPMVLVSRLLRPCITAPKGKVFLNADFSQIEARVLAWIAGQTSLIKQFAAGEDVYIHMAADIFNRPASSFDKKGFERFLGKTTVLGCGYQMGWSKFMATVQSMGGDITEELAQKAVQAYRSTNSRIKALWYDLDAAAKEAVADRKAVRVTPPHGKAIEIRCNSEWMVISLPSGRKLWYRDPRMVLKYNPNFGEKVDTLTHMGINGITGKWERLSTYGGKLTENVVQATARDCLKHALLLCNRAQLPPMFHAHDELMVEVNEDEALPEFKRFLTLVSSPAPWAAGLPLANEGWIGRRYKKD